MTTFLQLIRFPNLVMLALTQSIFYVYWILPFHENFFEIQLFLCVVIATVCIAAGGNIINDIFDVTADRINKPQQQFVGTNISKKKAVFMYVLFTFVGIVLGSYAAFAINRGWIALLFVGIAGMLYLYSSHAKKIPVVGNVIVSGLVASSLLILVAFDTSDFIRAKRMYLIAIYIYAIFAFVINLMREMVKDIEDINGDYNVGMHTLPIILGRNRVNKIVAVLAGILIVFILYIISEFLQGKTVTTLYSLLTILLPLLYFIIKIWQADSKREYRMLSLLLKLIMLFGILSILVMYYFDPITNIGN